MLTETDAFWNENDWTPMDELRVKGWMETELALYPELYGVGTRDENYTGLVEAYLLGWNGDLKDDGSDSEHPIWDWAIEVFKDAVLDTAN